MNIVKRTPTILHSSVEAVFDIETIPTNSIKVIENISKKIKPPGNLKRDAAIQDWIDNEKMNAVDEAIRKTALDGSYGRVCSIAWCVGDSDPVAALGDEKEIIPYFIGTVLKPYSSRLVLIGHNILGFDLRFLWKRMIILGIKIPSFIDWKASRVTPQLQDTMYMWDPDKDKRISLENLCTVLKVDHNKDNFDGSMVWDAWRMGKYEDIRTHNRSDVQSTRSCYTKILQR